jgi:hypothetical protein
MTENVQWSVYQWPGLDACHKKLSKSKEKKLLLRDRSEWSGVPVDEC